MHLIGLAMLGGSIFMSDLRALGGGLGSLSAGQITARLSMVFWIGLAVTAISGVTVAAGEVMKLYFSPPFWLKACALLAVLIFTIGVRDPIYRSARLTAGPVLLGAVAGLIWLTAFAIFAESYARWALAVLMVCLITGLAMGFRSLATSSWPCRAAACISITMWLTVAASGRWIAFY